jgi:hypothetical protein
MQTVYREKPQKMQKMQDFMQLTKVVLESCLNLKDTDKIVY